MASGLVAGCWVFLAGTMPFAKYTNREKSKGEVATCPSPPSTPLAPVPRRYVLVTPARIFKLQPFRNVKGDFCRTPSIGFNGHRYSNLFDGGSSSFNPSLPALLLYSYLLSLFLARTRSLLFAFLFTRRKPLHVTGASYRGLARARRKKNLHLARGFFSPLLRPSILAV